MKNIYSNIFNPNNKSIQKGIKALNKNELVGLPTETVYGLAGNAYSNKSVKKIYKLKGRPAKNPLIIHYADLNMLKNDAKLNKNFFKLYKVFCPGPITFVLKKKQNVKFIKICYSKFKHCGGKISKK